MTDIQGKHKKVAP